MRRVKGEGSRRTGGRERREIGTGREMGGWAMLDCTYLGAEYGYLRLEGSSARETLTLNKADLRSGGSPNLTLSRLGRTGGRDFGP